MFQDERGGPQHAVDCSRCGVSVLVKKVSLAHTVAQWTSSTKACEHLRGAGPAPALTPTCPFMRDRIDEAVRTRELEVGDVDVPTTNDSRSAGA